MTSVYYNDTDLTHLVEGNLSNASETKRIDFVELDGAFLVISGLRASTLSVSCMLGVGVYVALLI